MSSSSPRPDAVDFYVPRAPADALVVLEHRLASTPLAEQPELRRRALEAIAIASTERLASARAWSEALLAGAPILLNGRLDARANEERLARLVIDLLARQPRAERAEILESVLATPIDLSMPCMVMRVTCGEGSFEPGGDADENAFFGAATRALCRDVLDRVSALGDSGGLWSQASPGEMLWFWFTFGEEQRVYATTKSAIRQSRAVAALLDATIDRVAVEGRDMDAVAVRRWSRVVDLHALETEALRLSVSAPFREDRERARRFLEAYSNGKSELFR